MTQATWYVVIGFGAGCLTILILKVLMSGRSRRRWRRRTKDFTPSELWPSVERDEVGRDPDLVYFRHLHREDPAQPT